MKFLLRLFIFAEKTPALSANELRPRATFTRMKAVGDFNLACSVLNAGFEVAGMNRVLAEKFITGSFGVRNFVFGAEVDGALRPAIGFRVESVVLIRARHVSVGLRDDGRRKRANTVAVDRRRDQFCGTQKNLDRLFVPAGGVMKARLRRQ